MIAAIEAAVATDETNVALRCHLAELLAGAGRHPEALGHAARVLQSAPDHPVARRVVAAATQALGDGPQDVGPGPQRPGPRPRAPGPSPGALIGRGSGPALPTAAFLALLIVAALGLKLTGGH